MNEQISGETVRECTAEEDLYNTRNTLEQMIKMLPHKIATKHILYKSIRLLVPLMNPFVWCFVHIRTPVFFNVMGPVRDRSWSAIVTTWPGKNTENSIMQAQLDSLICITPAPLSFILIYQNEEFTAIEHVLNLILMKLTLHNTQQE